MIAPLVNARAKVFRANQHIKEFERRFASIVRDGYYSWTIENDFERKALVLKIKTDPLPAEISLILGDFFHCLRSALDQAVFEIIKPEPKDITKVQFPFVPEGESLESTRNYGFIEKSSASLAALIRDKIKPTERGNPALWGLHRMDIIDKHRAILTTTIVGAIALPTVMSSRGFMSMGNSLITEMGKEMNVIIGPLDSEFHGDPKFALKILIGESEAFTNLEIRKVASRCVYAVDRALGILEGRNPYTFRRR